MNPEQNARGPFEKVGECLYRYKPTGTYYARIKRAGKEIRQSLETTDGALAKRKLADKHRDRARIDSHVNRSHSQRMAALMAV